MTTKTCCRMIFFWLLTLVSFSLGILQSAESIKAAESWKVEWEKTLAAAREEGRLNIYLHVTQAALLDAGIFQRTYPGIQVMTMIGRGNEHEVRILAERRAGKFIADVALASGSLLYRAKALDPIKPTLILPEVIDESKWWQGKHHYPDSEGKYIFRHAAFPLAGDVAYNTNLVDRKEFKSLWDLVKPKWKGKILSRDVSITGSGSGTLRFYYHHPELGPQFIRRLYGEMNITFFRDRRQGLDWLINGKFAICLGCAGIEVRKAKEQGLPVDDFGIMKEGAGITSAYNSILLLNKAHHPSAAKVFINWFLSREGQLALLKVVADTEGGGYDSSRIDIPKDDVPLRYRRQEGVNYLDLDTPERRNDEPVRQVIKEALAEAERRKTGRQGSSHQMNNPAKIQTAGIPIFFPLATPSTR